MNNSMKKYGFSLVELSIVILIIGLLVAGVSSGTKLINQAKLRAVIAEADEMVVAYNTFKTTYDAVPGDMTDASVFFASCAETPANCNGDGDGNINWAAGVTDEVYKAMLHMSRAGITQNGIVDLPDAHVGNHQGSFVKSSFGSADNSLFLGGFGPSLGSVIICNGKRPIFDDVLAIYVANSAGDICYSRAEMTSLEAYQIDKKVDDGSTSSGVPTGHDTGNFRAGDDGSGQNDCLNSTDTQYNINSDQGPDSHCFVGFAVE